MPGRRQPGSLEGLSLSQVPLLVTKTVSSTTFHLVGTTNRLASSLPEVEQVAEELREVLLTNTAHCFHPQICQLVLGALSDMMQDREGGRVGSEQSQVYLQLSPQGRKKFWLGEQIILRFASSLFCHPLVTELDLSSPHLHPSLIRTVCSALPDISCLESLHLGTWRCRRHNLLGETSAQQAGLVLMFLPRLAKLSITDVSLVLIRNLATFCPSLTHLALARSEVNDEATSYISSLKNLRVLQLTEAPNVSPFGFAELLRNLPKLRSLGRCDCFGEVITTLYYKWSLYQRSVGSVPILLPLQEVDCEGPVSDSELEMIWEHCPDLSSIKLVYSPRRGPMTGHEGPEDMSGLSVLARLPLLSHLGVVSADFYSNSLFTVIQQAGSRLSTLQLTNVDEINLAAMLMIGDHCPNITSLTISCCHYTMETHDRARMEAACTPQALASPSHPFSQLVEASFVLTSSTHLPLIKYPVFFARQLRELRISQIYQPLEDSFIAALVTWNPMLELRKFVLTHGPHLTLMAANMLIQACPKLQYVGQVSTWGGVERFQLTAINKEVSVRNLDIVIE